MPKRDRTIFEPEPPVWKVRDIIEKLGGVGPIDRETHGQGFLPARGRYRSGLVTRNSVPGAWAPALFALGARRRA